MKREQRQAFFRSKLETREDAGLLILEGYFVVYNQRTELWPKFWEEIAPGACADTLSRGENILALFNHDSSKVLGSTQATSLRLNEDNQGLYGTVEINPNDTEAVNIYQRVKRGDVQGCSFGFQVIRETMDYQPDGGAISRLEEVDVFEVSVCPFPAYPQTSIQARRRAFEEQRRLNLEAKKEALRRRLHA